MSKEIEIIVLDDEVNILRSLTRMFQDKSFGIFATSNPEEAIKLIQGGKVKVVMSDQKMPKMEGVEFLRRVKEIKPDAIRILFTGHADVKIAEDAINRGEVYRFINKPWSEGDLERTFDEALKYFDLAAENKRLFELTQKQNRELEQLNRELQRRVEEQIAFSSTVSHELRTPLTSMKMAVECIVRKNSLKNLTEKEMHLFNIVRVNIDRLKRLIDDILGLSKLELRKETFKMQERSVNEFLQEVADMQMPFASEKGLSLKKELDPALPAIPVNPDKIHQLFDNLINNAIKFTEKGEVIISSKLKKENQCLEVHVKDSGEGIAEKDIPRLFQKFHQLGDQSRHVEGTGLGLALCKEIASLHGGNISVESELGKGSSFIVTFPLIPKEYKNVSKDDLVDR